MEVRIIMNFSNIQTLSSAALLRALSTLVARSAEGTAELLVHLAEVESRKLYSEEGYSSLFTFCTGALGLSESATSKRIQASRVARKVPAVLEALRSGRVHLCHVGLLAPHIDEANAHELLDAVSGTSKRKAEEWLATRFPKPDVRTSLRKLPERRQARPTHAELPLAPAAPAAPAAP